MDEMNANPADKRFEASAGDGIALGLIYVLEALDDWRRTTASVKRYEGLIAPFPPKPWRAYVKQLDPDPIRH